MVVLALLACVPRAPVGEVTDGVPAPARYAATVRDGTRELKLYDELTTVLIVRATYLGAPMRRAMEAQRAHLLLLEPAARDARLATAEAEAAQAHTVVFSAASELDDALDFGAGEDMPWRVRAFVDGRPCEALAVEPRAVEPLDRALLPHLTDWDELWEARFSRECGERGQFELQLTGPRGVGELAWALPARE